MFSSAMFGWTARSSAQLTALRFVSGEEFLDRQARAYTYADYICEYKSWHPRSAVNGAWGAFGLRSFRRVSG